MTYCLSIQTNHGLVLCSASNDMDSNEPSIQSNMHQFIWPGNRVITILTSGNTQTCATVLQKIQQDIDRQSTTNLLNANNLSAATDYIAALSTETQKKLRKKNKSTNFDANFIVAGQLYRQPMETLLIYTQGNYIHEPNTSPFLQMGETKFGKPILDRMAKRYTDLNTAARCALVSMDSSLRSSPEVTTPIELLIYQNNSLQAGRYIVLGEDDIFLQNIASSWANDITQALDQLPSFYWEG